MRLRQFENRWAEAALAAIFPGAKDDGLAGIDTMNVTAFMGHVMVHLPIKAALGLRLAIWFIALAPLIVLGRMTTVAWLSPAERERVVARLSTSRVYFVRSLVLLLKTFGAFLYASDARTRARMQSPSVLQSGVRLVRAKRTDAA